MIHFTHQVVEWPAVTEIISATCLLKLRHSPSFQVPQPHSDALRIAVHSFTEVSRQAGLEVAVSGDSRGVVLCCPYGLGSLSCYLG